MQMLKEMGIQSWRLRSTAHSQLAEKTELNSNDHTRADSEQTADRDPKRDARSDTNTAKTSRSQVDTAQGPADSGEGLTVALDSSGSQEVEHSTTPTQNTAPELDWQGLQGKIESAQDCPTCSSHNSVLGSGNVNAEWVFITDAPSSMSVQNDVLFSGRAASLFDAICLALDLSREDIYVTSIFKCAPTDDLSVSPQCNRFIEQQLGLLDPKVIVTFGEFSAQAILKANASMDELRANDQQSVGTGIPVVPTYSPAQMLDEPSLKSKVWQDLKKCRHLVSL